MNKLKTVFIRHKMDVPNTILEQIWNANQIALHYEDRKSIDPKDYGRNGKNALTKLKHYCKTGALVGADFRGIINNEDMMIGEISPDSSITATSFPVTGLDTPKILKVVQLKNTRKIHFQDYPLLAGIRPRQAAITGWPSASEYLQSIYYGKSIPLSVSSLHPSQLEVLCYEYLKKHKLITHLLMPIGRGLIDVDIWGIDLDGKNVIAQVTYNTNKGSVLQKVDKLNRYKNKKQDSILYFFAPEVVREDIKMKGQFFSIEDVFSNFSSPESPVTERQLVNKMLCNRN